MVKVSGHHCAVRALLYFVLHIRSLVKLTW